MTGSRRAGSRARPLAIAAALLVASALVWTAAAQAGSALVVRRDLPGPDALLMLASHEWERLPALAHLARMTPGAVVLLTEPAHPTPENCHECDRRVAQLAELGVETVRVEVLPGVTNTYDEAVAALEYCGRQSISRLMVVTSPYHTRRSLATFSAVFAGSGTVVGVRPAFPQSPAAPERWWRGSYDRAYVRYEWAALVWYALRYQVSPLAMSVAAAAPFAPAPVPLTSVP